MISVCVTEVKRWVGKGDGGWRVSGGGGRRQSWKAKLLQTQIAKAKQEGQQQEVARPIAAAVSYQRRLTAEKVSAPGSERRRTRIGSFSPSHAINKADNKKKLGYCIVVL